jgi:hypothetical protein
MAFNVLVTDPAGNTLTTASPIIDVMPASAVITATNLIPGAAAAGDLVVSNVGGVDVFYTLTADWFPTGSTTYSAATRLANELIVSVTTGTTDLFTGALAGLVDQPASPGQALTVATGFNSVHVEVLLPLSAEPSYEGIDLGFDLVFVGLT